MGIYNSQYESYYSRLAAKKGNRGYNSGYPYRYGSQSGSGVIGKNFIVKRLVWDLAGVFCLFILVTGCKIIAAPETTAFYTYAKTIVNETSDYQALISSVKEINLISIENTFEDYIDNLKSTITGTETLKQKTNKSYGVPLAGNIIRDFGYVESGDGTAAKFNDAIDIEAKLNSEVKACEVGTVKDCGEDSEIGKFVLIDHGKGIETKYGYLNEISVTKGEQVQKGQVIAKSGKSIKNPVAALRFQFAFMGQPKDPKQYIMFRSS